MQEESLLQKTVIAIMFIAFLFLMVWSPDFTMTEKECKSQHKSAYVKGLCDESKSK